MQGPLNIAGTPDALDELRADVEAMLAAANPSPLARDPDTAFLERYVRVEAGILAERDRIEDACHAMIGECNRRLHDLAFFMGLRAQAIVKRMLHGKRRSVKTPFGTIGFRRITDRIKVTSADDLPTEFLKPTPDLKAIMRAFRETSEVPEGCEYIPAADSFGVITARQPRSAGAAHSDVDDGIEVEDGESEEA